MDKDNSQESMISSNSLSFGKNRGEAYYSSNPTFYVGIDCIIFGFNEGEISLLLLKRNFEPAMGEWSLMGGFVQNNESVDDAAKRVLHELTGLENVYMEQVGTFGAIDRDPGERVISVAYYALININEYDRKLVQKHNAYWVNMNELPPLIFDHPEMVEKARREVENNMREEGEAACLEVGIHGIHPELVKLLGRMKFRTSYGQNALKHSIEVAQLSGLLASELGVDVRLAKRAGLLHDIGKSVDHDMEGTHVQLGADLCRKYKESAVVLNAVESHHGDVEPTSLISCIVQAADTISAARPAARRETLETYTNRLKQLEDITNSFKGVDKSFAIQAGREVRIMVVPEQISDDDMVLLARDISKRIEDELEYPGQIKVNVIRESS